MENSIGTFFEGTQSSDVHKSYVYAIFRIVIALMFMQHGALKLFGVLGGVGSTGNTVSNFSLLWFAGVIELVGGGLVALGLFARLGALAAVASMSYAYFAIHLPISFFPIVSDGELALLFLVSFLLIARYGAGRLSLERTVTGKEIF